MKRHRIVVADDDPIVIKFLSAIFQDEGYDVATALNGEEALSLIQGSPPDLVILDLVMPYRDGFEVCEQIRSSAETRNVPVIILTMKEREQDALHAFEIGADDYIRKPFNALELLARARKLINNSRT